jgi:amidase
MDLDVDDDATGLAAQVAAGALHPSELVDRALAALDAVQPALNAVVHRRDAAARAEAHAPRTGPFAGVPFAVKDLDGALAGEPYTQSCRLLVGQIARQDAEVIARMRRTGVIVVAKTNTPEFGILGVTEPELHGPTRNPWSVAHSPGGSSGGSAALVAARAVPFAHAGDGGGSIRIPAAHCGLFGLKPTRGRVPVGPDAGEGWSGYVQQAVVTRSVRDAARMLDAIAGPLDGDPYQVLPPARPYAEEVGAPPGRLRIALHDGSLFGRTIDPAHAEAVRATGRQLEALGHTVTIAAPTFDRERLVRSYLVVVAAGVAAAVASAEATVGRPARPGEVEPATWLLAQIGRALSALDLHQAREEACAAGRSLAAFHRDHDVWVTATTAHPPPAIGALALTAAERVGLGVLRVAPVRAVLMRVLADLAEKSLEPTPNTQLFNQTGQPAMSVPLAHGPAGLPIGVQFAAGFGREDVLFRLAAQLERAHPWAGRRPAVCAPSLTGR